LERASTITGVSLGMSMAGRFAAGWISEHFPRPHYILATCLLMQAAGTGCLMSLEIFGFWGLALFVPLFGLGYGGMIVLWPLTVGHDFGRRAFGAIAGVLGAIGLSLGGAAGPILAGALFDGTGSYDWAFGGCMSLFLVGACAAGAAPELGTVRPVLTTDAVAESQRSL
jgi:MFS family permease